MVEPTQVVMVTGATGGIGRAVVAALHASGRAVSVFDIAPEPVAALVAELNDLRPGSAIGRSGNAADPTDVSAWTTATTGELGRVDGLVNVAGLFLSAPLEELEWADIARVIEANLMTGIVCCKVVAAVMVAAGHGSIVNFASNAGEMGSISPAAHYAAAKGGIIGFSKSIARELSPKGVRVNVISPGPVDTAGLFNASTSNAAQVAQRTLIGRLGTPAEIAACVLFLIDDASSYVVGHVLRANGGSLL